MNGYFTAILLCSIFKTIKKWAALSFCLNMMNGILVSMRLSLYYQRVKSRWWRKELCLDKWGLAESLGNLPSCINAHEQPVWKVNYMFWWIKMPSWHNFLWQWSDIKSLVLKLYCFYCHTTLNHWKKLLLATYM